MLKRWMSFTAVTFKIIFCSYISNDSYSFKVLRRKEREFEHEMERLAREKISYQQRLASLKKELTAQWEHIDLNTLVPEIVEPEPRRISKCIWVTSIQIETLSEEEAWQRKSALAFLKQSAQEGDNTGGL